MSLLHKKITSTKINHFPNPKDENVRFQTVRTNRPITQTSSAKNNYFLKILNFHFLKYMSF